jgi:hypothetical protein
MQELVKAKEDLFALQQQAMQTKGRIQLQKRTAARALEEEKISGKLAKQSMDNINRQIKAIRDAQKRSIQEAESARRITKNKLDNINMELNRAAQKKEHVMNKLLMIGQVTVGLTGLTGLGYGLKALKGANTIAKLPGGEE